MEDHLELLGLVRRCSTGLGSYYGLRLLEVLGEVGSFATGFIVYIHF